jgi:hypothetical protein
MNMQKIARNRRTEKKEGIEGDGKLIDSINRARKSALLEGVRKGTRG